MCVYTRNCTVCVKCEWRSGTRGISASSNADSPIRHAIEDLTYVTRRQMRNFDGNIRALLVDLTRQAAVVVTVRITGSGRSDTTICRMKFNSWLDLNDRVTFQRNADRVCDASWPQDVHGLKIVRPMMVGIPQRNSICPTCPDCLGASPPATVAWILVLVACHFDCRRHSGLSLLHYKISFSSLSLSVCVSLISTSVDPADTLSVSLMLFVFIRFNHRRSL